MQATTTTQVIFFSVSFLFSVRGSRVRPSGGTFYGYRNDLKCTTVRCFSRDIENQTVYYEFQQNDWMHVYDKSTKIAQIYLLIYLEHCILLKYVTRM